MKKNGPEAKLLVVDDEPNIRELLSTSLRFAGFEVVSAGSGREALAAAELHSPDLAVLDVMLPDMDGFTVTRRLRAAGKHFPVLFLTAKDDTEDKVTGLTVGGDDYVTKPFSLDEVVARIRAVLRRTQPLQVDDDAVIRVDDLELDDDAHEVRRGGTVIELSPTEFKLLRYLMLNPNRVLSKAQILDHVWEYDFNGDASIVESYISYLRRKVDIDPDAPGPDPDQARRRLRAADGREALTLLHRWKSASLRSQLVAIMMALMLVALTATGAGTLTLLHSYLQGQVDDKLRAAVDSARQQQSFSQLQEPESERPHRLLADALQPGPAALRLRRRQGLPPRHQQPFPRSRPGNASRCRSRSAAPRAATGGSWPSTWWTTTSAAPSS